MPTGTIPQLITPGRIAEDLGVSLARVLYVLASRSHIRPAARAGTLRLFDREAVAKVQKELAAIDTHRNRKGAEA